MRIKVASFLIAVWGIMQGYYLYQIGASPSSHTIGWGLCIIALLLALSLLTYKNWVRILALVAAIFMLAIYGYFIVRNGISQFSAWLQPVLALVAVVMLVKPPSNKSLKTVDALKRVP